MGNMEEKSESIDKKISETNAQIEQKKEQNFVNLLIEIIVEITLKEYYEQKGD